MIDSNTTEVTVSVVVPLIPFADALMIVWPAPTVSAMPVSSTAATDTSLEPQVAADVKSFVVESP